MDQLDGIYHVDLENMTASGFKIIGDDEFWIKGHFPDRPLMPGVIQCEVLAQCCMFLYTSLPGNENKLFGFGGLQDVVFRFGIVPGDRMEVLVKCIRSQSRKFTCETQAFVNEKLVVSGIVAGVPL